MPSWWRRSVTVIRAVCRSLGRCIRRAGSGRKGAGRVHAAAEEGTAPEGPLDCSGCGGNPLAGLGEGRQRSPDAVEGLLGCRPED